MEIERFDSGMVLEVLVESERDNKLLFLLEHSGQGKKRVLPPVPAFHFQQGSVAQQVDGRFKQVDAVGAGIFCDTKRIPLVAAGGLALEVPHDAAQGGVPGLAFQVAAHEHAVVIGQAFVQAPGLDAVVDHVIVDAPPVEITDHVGGAPAGLGQGKHPGFLLLRLGLGRTGQGGEVLAHKGLHRLGKGKALDFDKIVQGRLAADPTGKPIPFAVADFQAVMLTGAVGVPADVYQRMGVEPLEVGQQVKLLCLGDLFRRNIAHLPSLPLARRPKPVSLPVVQLGLQFLACHGASTPFSDSNSRGDFRIENLPGYVLIFQITSFAL